MKKILLIITILSLIIVAILAYGFSYCSRIRNNPGYQNPLAGITLEEAKCMDGNYFKLGINLLGYEI